eukprot:3249261-Heterocapsa_arctica.AAC.1
MLAGWWRDWRKVPNSASSIRSELNRAAERAENTTPSEDLKTWLQSHGCSSTILTPPEAATWAALLAHEGR